MVKGALGANAAAEHCGAARGCGVVVAAAGAFFFSVCL